jgi:hypothetical protein
MATKAKAPKTPKLSEDKETILRIADNGKSEARQLADLVTEGLASNALTTKIYAANFGDVSLAGLFASIQDGGKAVNTGDFSSLERMLTGQAVALNAIFGELARCSAMNKGEHMGAMETYLKLALKAQSQSRATVEALAAIKNPPIVFAKQANINNGGSQQVNNGAATTASRTEEKNIHSHELLEASHGERLDFGAKNKAGGIDPHLEAVEAVHRPAK